MDGSVFISLKYYDESMAEEATPEYDVKTDLHIQS